MEITIVVKAKDKILRILPHWPATDAASFLGLVQDYGVTGDEGEGYLYNGAKVVLRPARPVLEIFVEEDDS